MNRSQVDVGIKAGHIRELETIRMPRRSGAQVPRNRHTVRNQGPFLDVRGQPRLKPAEDVKLLSQRREHLFHSYLLAWDRLPGFSNQVVAQSQAVVGMLKLDFGLLGDPLIGGIITISQRSPVMCMVF